MKKFLSILLFSLLFISILSGCKQEENTARIVAKNLSENLNNLSLAVNKLDSIDNKYLYNPDIYSSTTNTNRTGNNQYFSLAFNKTTDTTIQKESVKQALIDKITENLTSQGYSSNNCYTCKKYCDENGNCYYSDCNGNNYSCDDFGNYNTCESIPSTCSYLGERNLSCENTNEFNLETISTSDNNSPENNVDDLSENSNNNATTLSTPGPRVKMFYFTQDSFSPIKLKYSPRYINQYNETTINDQIEQYLYKVQKLYAMSEDSIEANTILQNCKEDILEIIGDINELNVCIINGECEPTLPELQALNNYISDLKTTIKRLKDCKGELAKEIKNIKESNSISNSMINSVDVMSSNYIRLINHIDTRITYHKSAIATLEQIKHLLYNSVNGNNISNEELEEIIENITIEDETTIDNNLNNSTSDQDVENSEENNLVDENNNIDNNIETNDSDNYNENTNLDYDSSNENTEENNNNEDVATYNESEELLNQDETEDDSPMENPSIENNNTNKIIDSYNSNNSWSNIDTYNENNVTEDNVFNNDSSVLEDDKNSNDIDNNTGEIVDNTTLNNNNIEDDDSNNNNVDTNNNDDLLQDNSLIDDSNLNNPINNQVVDSSNSIAYQNSVITQNNLNNDDGYGGYYYTSEGEIKNNGVNNNNEIGNNGNTIENNVNKENNVNTYGYNTLLDIINQGTVNNGINTL